MAWACTAGISHPDLRRIRLWSSESRADHGLENFGTSVYHYENDGRHVGTRTPDLYRVKVRLTNTLNNFREQSRAGLAPRITCSAAQMQRETCSALVRVL